MTETKLLANMSEKLVQVLQRRHLIGMPVEYLVKVRTNKRSLKEKWFSGDFLSSSSLGKMLLGLFEETKVGERGVDLHLGKRRSLSSVTLSRIVSSSVSSLKMDEPLKKKRIEKKTTSQDASRKKDIEIKKNEKKVKILPISKQPENQNNVKKVIKKREKINTEKCSNESRTSSLNKKIVNNKIISKKSVERIKKKDLITIINKTPSNKRPREKGQSSTTPQSLYSSLHSSHSSSSFRPSLPPPPPSISPCQCCLHCLHKCHCYHHHLDCCCSNNTKSAQKVSAHFSVAADECLNAVAAASTPAKNTLLQETLCPRKICIRQLEAVLELKEVSVRKMEGIVQLVLGNQSTHHSSLQNSFSLKTFREMVAVLKNLADDDCSVVLLSGSGSVFTSGIDLSMLLSCEGEIKMVAEMLRDFTNLLISFPKPLVAVVNGPAVGLGVAMLPLFDLVYASDKASFYTPYTLLSQPPEACSSHTFPRVMGFAMANDLLLRGRKITALEACQVGLVSQVLWPENLMNEVMVRVKLMSQQPAKALERTKALMRAEGRARLEGVCASECGALVQAWQSAETQACIKNFLHSYLDSL